MPKMTFVERDGNRREVEAPLGLSVLEIAHKHGVDIEGACEGSLACSTCRVVVAMSGGVDSSVTAALLVEQGFEVVGITLQLYDQGAASGRKGACCAGQDIEDA